MAQGQITYGFRFDTELQILQNIIDKLQLLNDQTIKRENKFIDWECNSYIVEMSPKSWAIIEPIVKLLTDTVHLSYEVLKEKPNVTIGFI